MIDFDRRKRTTSKEPTEKDVVVIGVGASGVDVVDIMQMKGLAFGCELNALDINENVVKASVISSSNCKVLGEALDPNERFSSDRDKAKRVTEIEKDYFTQLVQKKTILVTLELGDITEGVVGLRLLQHARKEGGEVCLVCSLPSSQASIDTKMRAEKIFKELRDYADCALVVSNQRVLENEFLAGINQRQALDVVNQYMAQAAGALVQLIVGYSVIPLSFADVRSAFGRVDKNTLPENCWVGSVEADMEDIDDGFIDEIFQGPFLSDEKIWGNVEHGLLCVLGGEDVPMSSLQNMIQLVKKKLPSQVPISVSASLYEKKPSHMKVVLLLSGGIPKAKSAPVQKIQSEPEENWVKNKEEEVLNVESSLEDIVSDKVSELSFKNEDNKEGLFMFEDVLPEETPEPILEKKPQMWVPKESSQGSVSARDLMRPGKIKKREKEESYISAVATPAQVPQSKKKVTQAPKKRVIEMVSTTGTHQEELQLGNHHEHFEKVYETLYNGENLDQPTFRRRKIEVRRVEVNKGL